MKYVQTHFLTENLCALQSVCAHPATCVRAHLHSIEQCFPDCGPRSPGGP